MNEDNDFPTVIPFTLIVLLHFQEKKRKKNYIFTLQTVQTKTIHDKRTYTWALFTKLTPAR